MNKEQRREYDKRRANRPSGKSGKPLDPNYHKNYNRERRVKLTAFQFRDIVAVDGEGQNTGRVFYHLEKDVFIGTTRKKPPKDEKTEWWYKAPDNKSWTNSYLNPKVWRANEHIYTLMCDSLGNSIHNEEGLPTADCFDFLLRLRKPYRLIVSFAFSYDINMILRDLPCENLEELNETTSTRWNDYLLNWIPRKTLSIRRGNDVVTVWDVFGYFQKSFVAALEEWHVGDSDLVAAIKGMKEQRGVFSKVSQSKIDDYCFDECKLLVELVRKLLIYVDKLDITLKRYDGAGSIAAAVMDKYDVAPLLETEYEPDETRGLSAYFGGRFEMTMPGFYDELYQYDINSAYPAALLSLPCLHCGQWKHSNKWSGELALVKVQWNIKQKDDCLNMLMPFPWRDANGDILYPTRGMGIYWSSEVIAAMALYPDKISVLECWIYETKCGHQPFAHIKDLYEQRKILKQAGDLGHLVLKLGYNSEYGKTAQNISRGKKPKYRNWLAAGYTTAYCRAKLLDAIRLGNGSVIALATDGLISTTKINGLPLSSELGEWGCETLTNCFLVRPNLYITDNKVRASGLAKDEIDSVVLSEQFRRFGPEATVSVKTNRFMGLSLALMRDCLDSAWRCWIEEKKSVGPTQHNRLYAFDNGVAPFERLSTIPFAGSYELSAAYKPKTLWKDAVEAKVPDMIFWLDQP